jgi:radical SAM protein with 4Fe4S-binding SPASM domain
MKTEDRRARGEIICRRESHGGTVFHPDDATFVQLDHEAFDCVKRVFAQGQTPRSDEERGLLQELKATLPSTDRTFRVVENFAPQARSLTGLLSSPILVDWQITERCGMGCPQCYASSIPKGKDVSWEDALLAVEQMREAGVCQVALGGGEPVLHPRLDELLELIRENGMVPNITTTGVGMSEKQLRSMKKNCGAVAMSLEGVDEKFSLRRKQGFTMFRKVADRFLAADVPLVFQVTVSSGNIDELDAIVEFCASIEPLYGVVFLAHKPAGRAQIFDRPLAGLDHPTVHEKIMRAVRTLHSKTRVGFDCCFTPTLVGLESDMGFLPGTVVEGCSATRSGVGLTPDLDLLPCTFLTDKVLGNLRERTLLEVWNGLPASHFRKGMELHAVTDANCRSCSANANCLGGCSAWSLTGCLTKAANA